MEKLMLVISAVKECYGIDDVGSTMTVGEIIDYLKQYADDTPVCISNDNGYTYGAIRSHRFKEKYTGEEFNQEEE
jgi:hypothetical protein